MNTSLPIYNYKEEIMNSIKENAVTIITAETGSGKSSQVPQYAYEAGYDVVVTEPRRIATWSLAQRVAEEMNTYLGDVVGYRTAFERSDSANTSILYCTDGLELVRTLADTNNKQKVLIIDEVHEWNLNIEVLVAWSKKKISEGWFTKVVIMSATLEKECIAKFFGTNVKLLDIPGKLFPVSFIQKDEMDLIPSIVEMVLEGRNTLVFVPGKREISELIQKLQHSKVKAELLPLHGEMDFTEQQKCFKSYSIPKVIVATNVAQTSITIPDIDAVIDTGKERRLEVYDGIQGLFLRNISKADCMQRKGRAGRTKTGKYILCSDTPFEYRREFSVPEIQRGILEQMVLRLATYGIDATEFEFFHQPSKESLIKAKETLEILGAIEANKVTPIGYKMAKIPVSVEEARMIVEAEKYGAIKEVICIAAILEVGSLLKNDTYYSNFSEEIESDLLAELDVWNALQELKYIDFDKLGINKKAFYQIKEKIKRMHEILKQEVTITSSDNRVNIKKSCVAGMINHVYKLTDHGYMNGDEISRSLDRKSCMYGYKKPKLLVGIPRIIEVKDIYGFKKIMNLVSMGTQVTIDYLREIAPQFISEKETDCYYSNLFDAVKVKKEIYFQEILLSKEEKIVPNHPEYERLKAEYQLERSHYYKNRRQEEVLIDGKPFKVTYWFDEAIIDIDLYTLYHTNVRNVVLEDGKIVKVYFDSRRASNIADLRNAVERDRIKKVWEEARRNLPVLKCSLSSILEYKSLYGKKEITCSNGGYGEPIYGFVCATLTNKSLELEILEDEATAENKMAEALEFLYGKIVCENFSEKRFKFKKGVKGLSLKEQKVKAEFDAEVRELLKGLDISNIEERVSYLKELYDVLVEDLKIA